MNTFWLGYVSLLYSAAKSQLLGVLLHYWLTCPWAQFLSFVLFPESSFLPYESLNLFTLLQTRDLLIVNEQILSTLLPTLVEQHFFSRNILPNCLFHHISLSAIHNLFQNSTFLQDSRITP